MVPAKAGERAVVDETLVKFAGHRVYLWLALEPESRTLIWLDMSAGRSKGDVARGFGVYFPSKYYLTRNF